MRCGLGDDRTYGRNHTKKAKMFFDAVGPRVGITAMGLKSINSPDQDLICPSPQATNFVVVSSFMPMGP